MTDKCILEYCNNSNYVKGLCSAHYTQKRRGQEFKPIIIKSNSSILPCSFSDCVNTQQAKGLCGAHWRQQHLGKPLQKLQNQVSAMERINKNIKIDKKTECWVWTGRKSGRKNKPYPQISIGGRQTMVHRITYEELVRPLEPGETIDHLCVNPLCVNPEHLEPVTLRENVKRMHAYKSLQKEIDRLQKFVYSLGYDPKTLLKKEGDYNAGVPS